MSFIDSLQSCRVLPVVTVVDVATTVRLTQALAAGGMRGVEVTLRTPEALPCITELKSQFPELIIAAGTITNAGDVAAAHKAGADFCVSPGISSEIIAAAKDLDVQLLPGVATPSEVMLGLSSGLNIFKLFPAAVVGGMSMLKSLGGPFPQVKFCPTGGLTAENYGDYLALPNVVCCGGSWMVAEKLVAAENWEEVERLAAAAMGSV